MATTGGITYDVVVIGGGINGLGIARDAAERGLSVALIEQEDLCAGVSAWSGRLVHGGLRYLERGDIPLVRESLRERELLFRVAPHLVKPVRLIMPFYGHNTRPSWMIRLGMLAYDVLSIDKSVPWHRILSVAAVKERFHGMSSAGLSGAALFTDGQVEYAERLCVELAVAASDAGAGIFTHAKAVGVLREGVTVVGTRVLQADGRTTDLHARLTINAAGPWVDAVLAAGGASGSVSSPRLIGGAKGSHIIVDPFPGAPSDVVYYESQKDGRLVLIIPWMGRYLIGCTDIKFALDPESARAESDEIAYLLAEVNTLTPEANLTVQDVLYTYSGVRPLPYAPDVPEWRVPRSHIVRDHAEDGAPGILSVIGGKLTTYRQLAEDATDAAVKMLGATARRKPISKYQPFPGARAADLSQAERDFLQNGTFAPDTSQRLWALYGTRSRAILELVQADASLAERFDPESAAVAAELIFAVEQEFAQTLTDVFARRILLAFEPGHGLAAAARAAAIIGSRRGWDDDHQATEVAQYRAWLNHLRVPDRAPLAA